MLSVGISVPRNLLIFSGSNLILVFLFSKFETSITPPTTSPAPSSSTSWHARLIASIALFGSRPFSNFPDASVRRPTLFDESLIFVPSKHAASKSIVLTSSVIIEFSPPIIPAIPTGFSASQIISTFSSNFLS